MLNKKIETLKDLETELGKLYARTEPELISEFAQSENANMSTHKITGCSDCPFVQIANVISRDQESMANCSYCLWDKTKTDISSFIQGYRVVPVSCPLINKDIVINLTDGNE